MKRTIRVHLSRTQAAHLRDVLTGDDDTLSAQDVLALVQLLDDVFPRRRPMQDWIFGVCGFMLTLLALYGLFGN